MPAADFLSHFEELRRRLIVVACFFLMACVVSFFFSHQILDFLTVPLRRISQADLFFQKPYDAFLIHLQAAAFSGLIFSSPVFFTQAWLFAAPGLYEKEKKFLLPAILLSVLLFLLGAAFAYGAAVPFGLSFLLSYQTESLKPLLNVESYFSFLSGMIIGFGIFFDFPVILTGLVALKVVKTETLSRARKGIVVFIFFAAAVLTPSPDPLSQIMLAVPLWILFEASLWICRVIEKKAGKR